MEKTYILKKDAIPPQDLLKESFGISSQSLKGLFLAKQNEMGLSSRQIQKMLSMESKTLNAILDGNAKRVNFLSAIKLANFLDISLSEIATSYISNLDKSDIKEIQDAKDAAYLQENFDIKSLESCFFSGRNLKVSQMSDQITRFFGFNSLYDYTKISITTAFSRTKRLTKSDQMRNFWVVSAYERFRQIENPNPYDREALKRLMGRIRPYTANIEHGFKMVMKALFQVGVTVIYQPSLKNVQVRGATMVVNHKPCIVICDFMKRYPTIWFSLLHELCHVLFDLESIAAETYHISDGVGDVFLTNEGAADKFATDYLLNDSRLAFAERYINSPIMLNQFAAQCSVHPSIIYARYCYETNEWSYYQKYIPKTDKALSGINVNPFEKETLKETVKEIKELYNV
ncbi:MAG: pirin [Prevotella sp.]|nr:pirin [Prevotella sp.]